jgi:hypothetical protein
MKMKLISRIPENYDSHNTGGEHAYKHSYDGDYLNNLRLNYLPGAESWDLDEIKDLQLDHFTKGELVTVNNMDPKERSSKLVAGGLMRYLKPESQFEKPAELTDIVVAPDHRRRKLASFILGDVWKRQPFSGRGFYYPTSLSVDTEKYKFPAFFEAGLTEVGFGRHSDDKLELKLPGMWFMNSFDNAGFESMVNKMPESWNGVLANCDDGQGPYRYYAFRDRQNVGFAEPVETVIVNDRVSSIYELYASDGSSLKSEEYDCDELAIVDLINQPNLK